MLEDGEEEPRKNIYSTHSPKFNGDSNVKYSSFHARANDSIEHGSRFDSFSIAQTAYANNSSLFLNASKNLIAIDSVTSTRNKVGFFKNSLVIVKDEYF